MSASFLWDIAKLCRPRSDDNAASDRGLHICVQNVLINLNRNGKYHLTPLNWKWARPSDKVGKFIRLK